jgi:uncharacterized membrane protein YfcA
LLSLAAFAAGFVDAVAGGGGLIGIPALLLAGLSPVEALATNKLQALFGAASATVHYASRGLVEPKRNRGAVAACFAGGVAGALMAALAPVDLMRFALPFVLVAIAAYFGLKPSRGDSDRAERLPPSIVGLVLVPAIGFYDGIFGPGSGSFFVLALVSLSGFGLLKATAHGRLFNLASNLGALAAFVLAGAVAWKIGLFMGVAQVLGARAGAALAIRTGARLVRPLLVMTCLALTLRLLADPSHPLRTALGI